MSPFKWENEQKTTKNTILFSEGAHRAVFVFLREMD